VALTRCGRRNHGANGVRIEVDDRDPGRVLQVGSRIGKPSGQTCYR
jgi:hypothetical protein